MHGETGSRRAKDSHRATCRATERHGRATRRREQLRAAKSHVELQERERKRDLHRAIRQIKEIVTVSSPCARRAKELITVLTRCARQSWKLIKFWLVGRSGSVDAHHRFGKLSRFAGSARLNQRGHSLPIMNIHYWLGSLRSQHRRFITASARCALAPIMGVHE